MSKISLTDLVNLQNETTAVNAINGNNATLETAMDNTLSRDGTQPNQMGASLDMNSNRVLNLPAALSGNEPATLNQLSQLANHGTLVVAALPSGGTTGQVIKKNSNADFDVSFGNVATTVLTGTLQAAQFPALTTDVTTSAGSLVTTLGAPAITGKASKATPTTADLMLISDQAAAGALKQTPLSALPVVRSIAGNTGAFTLTGGITNSTNAIKLAYNGAVGSTSTANPTGTVSGTGVMMGLGSVFVLTPATSSRVIVHIQGQATNSASSGQVQINVRFGTGTAPTNGVALTGTSTVANQTSAITGAGYVTPFHLGTVITGLTPGTAYWFDLGIIATAGTGSVQNVSYYAIEI